MGSYKELFIFIAPRFLSNPDHVLDAEGIHARWQWVEAGKRNIKLKALNAILRLASWMHFFGDLPPLQDLMPHLQAVRRHLNQQYQAVLQGGEVAAGARSEFIYRHRFNL